MKKKYYPLLVLLIILVIFIVFLLVKDKDLDTQSDLVTNLYSYLGEVDVNYCGGLNAYSNSTVSLGDIPLENRLCLAYHHAELEETAVVLDITKTIKDSPSLCQKGDLTFATSNGENCTISTVTKEKLNASYKKMYGQDLPDENYESFYISSTNACYLEGEMYYCGEAQSYSYTITAPATIYRLIVKATKNKENINITDYYLKVSDNKCYGTGNNSAEITECTDALAQNEEIDKDFLKKYGTKYIHTYKKLDNDIYYWYKSVKH